MISRQEQGLTQLLSTEAFKKAYNNGLREAGRLKNGSVFTEHLLLGLLADPNNIASQLLGPEKINEIRDDLGKLFKIISHVPFFREFFAFNVYTILHMP